MLKIFKTSLTEQQAEKSVLSLIVVSVFYLLVTFNVNLFEVGYNLQQSPNLFTDSVVSMSVEVNYKNGEYGNAFSLWLGYNI